MPRFLSSDGRVLISTSYKVMYSSLSHQPGLREIPERHAAKLLLRDSAGRPQHIVLGRNPYTRFRAFFRDKLRGNLADRHHGRFQWCQRFILWELGVSPLAGFAKKREALLSLGFEDMLALLPRLIWNGHLKPQSQLLWSAGRRLPGPEHIVRIEDGVEQASPWLADIGRHNAARPPPEPMRFHGPGLAGFNALYAGDFDLWGYARIAGACDASACDADDRDRSDIPQPAAG